MEQRNDTAIEITGLRKHYGNHTALDGMELRVPAGSVYGFLGRNGAGKTTTIKIIMGLLRADEGGVRVLGQEVRPSRSFAEIKRRIGFVTETKDLYPFMTVAQMIRFTRSFFPAWRADLEKRLLELFELPLRRKVTELSKGMRSKLMLLLAMARGAELLVLDEPADGLDPVAIDEFLRELMAVAAEGTTVFFSSHQLAEVEQVADHVCIVERGKAVVSGMLDDMKAQYRRLQVVFEEAPPLAAWAEGADIVRQEGRVVSVLTHGNVERIVEKARSLRASSVEAFPVTLRELFLEHVRNQ